MPATGCDEYLITEVMTATPQKLQLMLIEGAIRYAERARQHLRAGQEEEACEALIRAQDIVAQILAGINREVQKDLVKKVAAVYVFVFRRLMEASFHHDQRRVAEAIEVLEVERETWRQLCDKLAADPEQAKGSVDVASFRPAATPTGFPNLALDNTSPESYAGGFSLDA